MELLDKLPQEMHWNVMKYMQHPLATILKNMGCRNCQKTSELRTCDMCENLFCVQCEKYDEWSDPEKDMLVCINCLVDNHTECQVMMMQWGDCWHRGLYHDVSQFIDFVCNYYDDELDRHPTYFDTLYDTWNKKMIRQEFNKKCLWEQRTGESYEEFCYENKFVFAMDDLLENYCI